MKDLYTKHRTKIWAIVWFIVGITGGNLDRITTYVKTIYENPAYIEQQINLLHDLELRVKILEKRVDKIEK